MCQLRRMYGNGVCTICTKQSTCCSPYVHPFDIQNSPNSSLTKEEYFGYYKSWECKDKDHIFVWTSGCSTDKCPSEQKCLCGRYTWAEYNEAIKPSIWDGEEK
jgi:hypothetical protein